MILRRDCTGRVRWRGRATSGDLEFFFYCGFVLILLRKVGEEQRRSKERRIDFIEGSIYADRLYVLASALLLTTAFFGHDARCTIFASLKPHTVSSSAAAAAACGRGDGHRR